MSKKRKKFPKKNINHNPQSESTRRIYGILVKGVPHIQNSHFPNSPQTQSDPHSQI